MLGYLAMYFNDYVGLNDVWAGRMVGVLTAGITISMFFLGSVTDKIGVRRALITAFLLMLVGRVFLSLAPFIGLPANGLGSVIHFLAMGGILLVVVGYGLYQPSAYSAVKQFTSAKTAAMGFAMLYALMNLGGWMPTFFPPIRKAIGISGCYWVYVGLTGIGLFLTLTILTRRTVNKAIATAKAVLVGLYYMHLRWDKPFNAFVFLGAFFLLALFVGIAMMDTQAYQPNLIPGYSPGMGG